jgi:type I restriction enzyme, S subunit
MKKYPVNKDSGIQWIGEIPEHWEMKCLKFWVKLRNEKVSNTSQFDFRIALENIEKETGKLILGNGSFEGVGNTFKVGDILFNKLRPYLAKVYEADKEGVAVGELLVLEPLNCVGSFLKYRLLSKDFIDIVDSSTYGAKMPRANWNFIGNINLPYPPYLEQSSIALFLDKKTSEIDQLIASKAELIQRLEAQRKAIINEAVTGQAYKRGLIPMPEGIDMKFKDSGIEWLGEIPEHWKVVKLKYMVSVKGRLGWKGLKAEEYIEKKGYGFLSTPDIKYDKIDFEKINFISEERYIESPEIMLENKDVLLVKDGSTLGIVNIIDELPIPTTVNSSIALLRVIKNDILLPDFLKYFLESELSQGIINLLKGGQGVPHLYQSDIKNFDLLIPSINEQEQIIYFLKEVRENINDTISNLRLGIEKLQQYKQSLISEAVTGKIDVREWQKDEIKMNKNL